MCGTPARQGLSGLLSSFSGTLHQVNMYMKGQITCKVFSHVEEVARLRQRIGYHDYHETCGLGYCDTTNDYGPNQLPKELTQRFEKAIKWYTAEMVAASPCLLVAG